MRTFHPRRTPRIWLGAATLAAVLLLQRALHADSARVADAFSPPDASGWGEVAGLRYLEAVHGGANPDNRLPLVVLLHGLGDRPRADWLALVPRGARARIVMPQAPTPYGHGYSWFPYRAAGTHEHELAASIAGRCQQLTAAIELLREHRPTRGKPIVLGFSQGGMLSFALAVTHGQRLSYALPISGLLPAALWPTRALRGQGSAPIRALHGSVDETVPIESDRALVKRLRALGYDVRLREFPGVGHTISPKMRAAAQRLLSVALRAVHS